MAQSENQDIGLRRGGAVVFVLVAALGAGCQGLRPIAESELAANVGKPVQWVDANGKADPKRYDADYDVCHKQVYQYSDDNKNSDRSYEMRRCLRLKGWHEVPVGTGK